MPKIFIEECPIISYDSKARDKYWGGLTKYIFSTYNTLYFRERKEVETVLLTCFDYLHDRLVELIKEQTELGFYLYIFYLHEESIKLYRKIQNNYTIQTISETEFALYRRILKLIIEEGCEVDMNWGNFPNKEMILYYDEILQELLYLATWYYYFSEQIAYQKMIGDCQFINTDENGLISINWKNNFGYILARLQTFLDEDFEGGIFDEFAVVELKKEIENCFGFDYTLPIAQINNVKNHLNQIDPNMQTVEPYILPINLSYGSGVSFELATIFFDGLTLSRRNKNTLKDSVLKPYSPKRYLFKPIIIYKVGDQERALIGNDKIVESFHVLATNALHWNSLPTEWCSLKCITNFMNKKGNEHDKILEDKIEVIVNIKNLIYCRNIKSFKQPNNKSVRIDNQQTGEIDFLIIDSNTKTLFVCEAKYNKARYEAVGFQTDNTNFINDYEPILKRKVNWIIQNINVITNHLIIAKKVKAIELSGYKVEGVFLINTPTFYMFNGYFKAITINRFSDFLDGKNPLEKILIGNSEFKHPF